MRSDGDGDGRPRRILETVNAPRGDRVNVLRAVDPGRLVRRGRADAVSPPPCCLTNGDAKLAVDQSSGSDS
jgi:hypothetical protein